VRFNEICRRAYRVISLLFIRSWLPHLGTMAKRQWHCFCHRIIAKYVNMYVRMWRWEFCFENMIISGNAIYIWCRYFKETILLPLHRTKRQLSSYVKTKERLNSQRLCDVLEDVIKIKKHAEDTYLIYLTIAREMTAMLAGKLARMPERFPSGRR